MYVALGGDGILKQKLEDTGIYTFSILALERDISATKETSSFKEIFSIIKNKRPDVLHLHSPKAGGLGALAGRILRVKKIIYTVHGWAFNEDRPVHQKCFIALFSWFTMILAHTTILLSEREYKQALTFPLVKNKLALVSLGIKPPIFISLDGSRQALAKKIGIPLHDFNKKTIIGTIAELHPNKGLPYLIKSIATVVKQYPNTLCLIIGDGQGKATLHMIIKENKLEQHVFLLGYIDQASDYLKAFNIFVLPSTKEGLPYVILEAGCASLPIVSTIVGGIPEIIEDMKSGILIQSKNSRELAHALSFMIEHPEERKKYGNRLKEKIVTNFSIEKMIENVERIYQN